MEQPIICGFSEKARKRAKQNILILQIFFPVALAAFLVLSPLGADTNLSILICVATGIVIILEAILIVQSNTTLRKMEEMTLTVSAQGMERSGGRFTEKFDFSEIRSAEIHQFPSGEVAYVKVILDKNRVMNLGGFDCMETVAHQLETAAPDPSMVLRKKLAVDWGRPIPMVALLVLAVLLLLGLSRLGQNLYRGILALLLFSYGLYGLIYRPLTRSIGKRFEKFEILLSILLLISAVLQGAALAAGIFLVE